MPQKPYLLPAFFVLCLSLALLVAGPVLAQPVADQAAPTALPSAEGLKVALNQSGSHYFQVTFLNQTWLRYNQSNPGTVVQGQPRSETFDIGLRRTRIQLFGQIAERAFLYFQFGQNNFNASYNSSGNRKLAPFFHDALGEYRVTRNNGLKLGAGLTVAQGLSRFTQPGISSILTLDVPVFAQATVDATDQFNRKLSVYARGQVGPLDYRLILSDPFPVTSNGNPQPAPGAYANFAQVGSHKQYQAYLAYNFLEMEPHTTPYMAGTYLGKRRVLNVAAGVVYQPNATWTRPTADTLYHNMLLWSAEAFLDIPLNTEKGTALSAYAGHFSYDFGPGYLRFNGLMNPATGNNSPTSLQQAGPTFGNAVPMFGTGTIQYAQAGYLLPRALLGQANGQLQPFASYTRSALNRLGSGNEAHLLDVGANWLINGHRAKLSIDFQNRPTYRVNAAGNPEKGPRKNALILQYQLFI